MDLVHRSVIFHDRSKERGYRRIHTRLVAAYGQHACPTESVKYWVREYDRGRRDPADSARAGRPRSDIAGAASHILGQQPFSSTKFLAAELRTRRDLVTKTLVKVLRMKTFSLRWAPDDRRVAQKRQRVADSRRRPQTLRADAANQLANTITAEESWYYWFYQYSSQWSTSRDLVSTRTLKKIDS
jgi:hypothetical protein